jgi:hypothetical protein
VTYAIGGGLGNTLGDHLGVTFLVTGISTIFTLVSLSGKEEFLTQGTHDGLVELSLHELMAVHLVDVALSLSDGTLSTQSFVWTSTTSGRVLDWIMSTHPANEHKTYRNLDEERLLQQVQQTTIRQSHRAPCCPD